MYGYSKLVATHIIHSRKKQKNNLIIKDQILIKYNIHVQIIVKKALNFRVSIDERSNCNSRGIGMNEILIRSRKFQCD